MYRPLLHAIKPLALLTIALVISACASTPNIYSNVDKNADFGKYQTFGFFETLATDRSGYETSESRYLKNAVTREMGLRNIRSADDPDLKVNFYINTSDKIRSRQTPTTGGYYGYRSSYYGAWGGYETRIDQYTEGTLNIDVVDAGTQKLVWEGTIVGKITDEVLNNLEAVIDEAVKEIFRSFPVPPRGDAESD